jgi:hypothetical protein
MKSMLARSSVQEWGQQAGRHDTAAALIGFVGAHDACQQQQQQQQQQCQHQRQHSVELAPSNSPDSRSGVEQVMDVAVLLTVLVPLLCCAVLQWGENLSKSMPKLS